MFKTIFTVEGSGTFPFDMLRYDGCFPADEASSYEMAPADEPINRKRSVNLVRYHVDRSAHLTPGRWESFGWRIIQTISSDKVR